MSASTDEAGRVGFQGSSEGYVSLTLPLDANAGRPTGPVVRQTFWANGGGRNSMDDAGRLLAYQKPRGNETELWIKDVQTGQERHLVTTRLANLNPVIAHDGAQVAYTLRDGDRTFGYVVPASGGTERQVCECSLQGWFADNRRILGLDGLVSSARIRVIDVVDRSEADLLSHPTTRFGRADISPDSRWLAFGSVRHVWVAPVRPGAPPPEREWVTILEKDAASAERACGWSPDGRLLYLLLERDGFRDLYAQRIDPARGAPVGQPFVGTAPARSTASLGIDPLRQRHCQQRVRVQPGRDDGYDLASGSRAGADDPRASSQRRLSRITARLEHTETGGTGRCAARGSRLGAGPSVKGGAAPLPDRSWSSARAGSPSTGA